MSISFFLLMVSILSGQVFAQNNGLNSFPYKKISANNLNKTNYLEHYNYIAVNSIKMWVGNDGSGSHDPITDGSGFYWPGGKSAIKASIFTDGLVFGAKVNEKILFGGTMYLSTLQGGKVINKVPDNALIQKYRVFKINRLWETLPPGPEKESRKKDYNEWPIEDGAPYEDINGDGVPTPCIDKPRFLADETLWYVSNDLEYQPIIDFPPSAFSSPLGIEMQTTVFGYKTTNILGDAVFKHYKLINKGNNYLTDMYISIYSDPDLGDAGDDFIGCDTLLDIGFVWNSDNLDGNGSGSSYGENPPSAGYTIIAGPIAEGISSDSALYSGKWIKGKKNLGLTGFVHDIEMTWNPRPEIPASYYNLIQGRSSDGDLFINPVTGEATTKILSGDPTKGIGWYEGEGWPNGPPGGDRRFFLSSGPFNLSPGDTQEVVYAIHMAKGSGILSGISQLKEQSSRLKEFYFSEFSSPITTPPVEYKPEEYKLEQNYPNPFNPTTTISYEIPYDAHVILKIFDILGNELEVIVAEFKDAGNYEVTWSAQNFSAGVYFYQIESGGFVRTRKMVLMK